MRQRPLKFSSSGFAILDVTRGRKALAKHFSQRPSSGECPKSLRLPIVIYGYVDDVWGKDDGESQEFAVTVTGLARDDSGGPQS